MLEIKNTEVFGLERTILASGNSFAKTDINTTSYNNWPVSEKDIKRASKLGGSIECHQSHDSFLKGIIVQFDVRYPQYWSMEAQRYHWFDIVMSSSKMHRLVYLASQSNDEFKRQFNKYVDDDVILKCQNYARNYNSCESQDEKYTQFMKLISNLPMGYELWMTISTNYLQLKTMYIQRKDHKLKEDWGVFCDWCLSLPMFSELTGLH